MRVLVFDDDPAIGRLVCRVACMAGLDAVCVSDAPSFHQQLEEQPPQLVLLDLQLGNTDGIEQLRFLAEQNYRGSLILMSGFDPRVLDTAGSLARSLNLSLEGVLEKPIRLAELEALLQQLRSRQPSIEGLIAAIAQDELTLEFQPVVTRSPRTLRKLEALVRWNHPELGRLPPAAFLAMAETVPAAIDALTEWVFQHAIRSWRWLAACGIQIPIAVNVSSRNLHDLSLPDRLEARLRDAAMPPGMLCLEITESAAFSDTKTTMDVLTRLRLKGMELALDDFGTGYASLKLLRQMPFSAIKIDQSFVSDMLTSRDSGVIVKCITDLAANLEMESIAEGVETEPAAAKLEQMGVTALQGYLIAAAMPAEALPGWWEQWSGGAASLPAMVGAAAG